VARDLHDEFGQILTAIGVMLSRAGRKALDQDPLLIQDLEAVKTVVEETLQKVRDQSQMLRPAILDDFGLAQTLEWFVQQFSRQAGLTVHFDGRLKDGFSAPEEAIHVYRIVQEALNNVARHSNAREAWVVLNEHNGTVDLEIRDAGAGFEAGAEMAGSAGKGVGLMGMRERAEHLGGSLTVLSEPGQGTVVKVSVPAKKA
jgi:signal transduction histidine kinase